MTAQKTAVSEKTMGKKEQKKLGGPLSPAPFLALFLVHLVHFSGLNERERKRQLRRFAVCSFLW